MWKLPLAIVITVLIVMPRANASPSQLNNQEQATGNAGAMTPIVANEPQTVTAQAEQPQIVPVTENIPPTIDVESEAKAFIYFKESRNDPLAKNSIGCFGLGQDCNGIVEVRCGGVYSCQDAYFTQYMLNRYGTWQAAKTFWLSRVPINGRDVGNWW